MLLQIPVELETEIMSYLPRRDLASLVRTCQHVQAVAIPFLYACVQLRSFDQIQAFFLITTTLQKSSATEIRHAETKRSQWSHIRTLDFRSTGGESTRSLGSLPRSLRQRGVEPFPLDRIRISYYKDVRCLVPLLQCFDPVQVAVQQSGYWISAKPLNGWTASVGWKRTTHLVLGTSLPISTKFFRGNHPFAQVSKVTLVCLDRMTLSEPRARPQADLIARICPQIANIEILVSAGQTQSQIEQAIRAGQWPAASAYSVEIRPERTWRTWGERAGEM